MTELRHSQTQSSCGWLHKTCAKSSQSTTHEHPPLDDGFKGEGEPVVFKGVASGVLIKLQWMAQTHEFMSNTNWTRRVIKREKSAGS